MVLSDVPLVVVIVNTWPTERTRSPGRASDKLSLPSQKGCWVGSAMSPKISDAATAMSRLALTTRGTASSLMLMGSCNHPKSPVR